MRGGHLVARVFETRRDLEQASWVARHDEVGTGLPGVTALAVAKLSRRFRLQQVINAGGSAAHFWFRDFAQLELRDRSEQEPRGLPDPLSVLQVTRIMVRDAQRKRVPRRPWLELRQ